MKSGLRRTISFIAALILLITALPFSVTVQAATFNQIVNASTHIIIKNEGNYTTVVRNDVGALSIGVIGWHATNALNLLKEIIALNPTQALNILGANLYNEIITSTYWESKIPTREEASAISVLISTTQGRKVQDKSAAEYISRYVRHGQDLGIAEPEALVFFADFENQNGRTGAKNYFNEVMRTYGIVNLQTLYECSSKNNRRTRTYNFCATINWGSFTDSIHGTTDKSIPTISNVTLSGLSVKGYTISCDVQDDGNVTDVYFAVFPKSSGSENAKWYKQTPVDGKATHTVEVSEFSGKAGEYCTYIYAFDEAGNYSYVELNIITVPELSSITSPFSLTVSASGEKAKGEKMRWVANASNGSGRYLYQFEIYKDGEVIERRRANDFSELEYRLDESGTYKATVTCTDSASGKKVTVDSAEVNIFDPIVAGDFASEDDVVEGFQWIEWNLTAGGGEGELEYSYTLYKDSQPVESTAWGDSTEFRHRAISYGVYHVVASIKDSRMQTVSVRSNDIIVTTPLEATGISFSDDYAVAGKAITVSADITGGTGNYSCSFIIYCNGNEVASSQAISSTEYTFNVPQGGNYTAKLIVTDTDGKTAEITGGELNADEIATRGDANCDGTVSAADARYALRCAAMLIIPEAGLEYASDLNGDGRITASDARKILRISAQLEE